MDIQKVLGNVATKIKQTVTPFLNNLNQNYQTNISNFQSGVQNVASNIVHSFNPIQTPKSNLFNGLEPHQIINKLSEQPLIQSPSLFGFKSDIKSPTLGQAADFLADIPRNIARIGFEGAQTLAGDKNTYQFKSGIGRQLLDDRPLQNWNDPNRPSREFLRVLGFRENDVNKIAPFMIGTGLALDVLPPTSGKAKLGKEAVEQVTKEESMHKLRELLSYEDQLAKWGLNQKERAKYSVNEARKLFEQGTEAITEQKQKVFDKLFETWMGERNVAKTTGFQTGSKFKNIPANLGWDVITAIENPAAKVNKEALKYVGGIRKEYDDLFKNADQANINLGYLKNYISHVWQQSPEEVSKILQAGQKFGFGKKRFVNSYQEGIERGLTPKFTHPAEIIAEYSRRLEVTKANIKFFKQLQKEGVIVGSEGAGKLGFSPITAQGFPASISRTEQGVEQNLYYAPTKIANLINRIFSESDPTTGEKIAEVGADISGRLQDIHLAGGVVGTPLNAFSLTAGLQKEMLVGRFVSPIKNFLMSFSQSKTDQFFNDNIELIKTMQRNGIDFHGLDIEKLIDRGFIKNLTHGNTALEKLDTAWQSSFNDPTFKRFFPSLQIQFFKDTYEQALNKYGTQEAEKIATEATKRFYGLVSVGDQAKRSKLGSDILTIGLFAPKYRESLIRFLTNVVKNSSPLKAVNGDLKFNNPLSLENQHQTRFLIGALTTYITFDYLNKQFTGNHLQDNPKGHELEVLIPVSKITGNKNDNTVLRLPFLPSLLTIPRMAYQAGSQALAGENVGALRTLRGLASSALQVPLGLALNENYWGQPIYGQGGQGVGNYVFEQVSHPYLSAVNEQYGFTKNKPPAYQTLIKALEIPIRFTTEKSLDAQRYFAVKDEVLKGLSEDERKAFDIVSKKNTGDIRQTVLEARLRLNYPAVLRAETEIARRVAKEKDEPVRPFYMLPQRFQNVILTYQSLPPGNDRSAVIKDNIDWLKVYYDAENQYWSKINEKNPNQEVAFEKTDPAIQKKIDEYYSLPVGTGQRSLYSRMNPDLVSYWDEKKQENNNKRIALGLSPMPEQSFNNSSYTKKPRIKKISLKIPKPKKIKIKAPKIKKFKLPKFKDIELPKLAVKGVVKYA